MTNYDGHDDYACPYCGGKAVDVDPIAQPDLACACSCHEQNVSRSTMIERGRLRDELAAKELGTYTPVQQVLDQAAEREEIWAMMVTLAQDVAEERQRVRCRCVGTHDEGCSVLLAQQILARLQEE
jgi:hypothetical protein